MFRATELPSVIEEIEEFDPFAFRLDASAGVGIEVDVVQERQESRAEIARKLREAVPDVVNFNELADEGIAIKSEARKSLTVKGGAKHSIVPSSWKPSGRKEQVLTTPPEREEIMKRKIKGYTLYYLMDRRTGKPVQFSTYMKRDKEG